MRESGQVVIYMSRQSDVQFDLVLVSEGAQGLWSVHVADIDGDGKLDILSAATTANSNMVSISVTAASDLFPVQRWYPLSVNGEFGSAFM